MVKSLNCLISAGPTREWIDPVRFISNPSSGKMGYALASEAYKRNFKVNLVSGPVLLPIEKGIDVTYVESAEEMSIAMMSQFNEADLVIMCAAVCDHKPKKMWSQKRKKADFPSSIELVSTQDILFELGKRKKENQKLVGFAAETESCEENAKKKLNLKNLDWIALNDVSIKDIGFESDLNEITLYSNSEKKVKLSIATKEKLAAQIFDIITK
jgi:phosphopantothenoylcysteine decarboxylase/phosphopantothenate--cysteine ligase